LKKWHEFVDVLANEIIQCVSSHVCEALVQVVDYAMIINEGNPARK
jgi:hypothetical protein